MLARTRSNIALGLLDSLVVIFAATGCSSSVSDPGSETGGQDQGEAAQCLPEVEAPIPSATDPIVGPIHRVAGVDAFNLLLDQGGQARATAFGCDFCQSSSMRWSLDEADVLLEPRDGASTLEWYDDVGIAHVSRVRLSRLPDGRIEAHAESENETFVDLWEEGGTRAKCCGSLGPTARFACDEPHAGELCEASVEWSCDDDCAIDRR